MGSRQNKNFDVGMDSNCGRPFSSRMCLFFAVAAYSFSGAARADFEFSPYAASQTEYNSNVFDVSNANQAVIENGNSRRSDTLQRYLVGANSLYHYGQQEMHASVEGRRFDYRHFDKLDHDEYLLDGALEWVATDNLSGGLNYRQERRMTSFADRNTSDLSLERDRLAGARVDVILIPDWILKGGLKNHELASPIPGIPDFSLTENSANFSAGYLGLGAMNAGLDLEYLRGEYRGIPGSGKFDQTTLELISSYDVSGITRLDAKLGYTQRKDKSNDAGGESGITGTFRMSRKLSEITAARVQVFRRISSYTAGTAAVTDTGASADLNWNPTFKIIVNAEYSWIKSNFDGQGMTGSIDNSRRDRSQEATLKIKYQALNWLLITPYTSYLNRSSSIDVDNFKAVIAGFEVRISLGLPFKESPNEEASVMPAENTANPQPDTPDRLDNGDHY